MRVLCFPVNLLLSQNNNITLRGLRKSTFRCACALLSVHGAALYMNIDHIMKCEHECTPLRLPRTMASMVIFPYQSVDGIDQHFPDECKHVLILGEY
jgi:hypothetical protein